MDWNNYIPELPSLAHGGHEAGSGQLCAMEMVAFMERLPHSDRPDCTCPVLAEYVRCINDRMPDDRRNDLLPVLPLLTGTVNNELEQKRAEHFAMSMVTKLVPLALRGRITDELVDAMISAPDLESARAAAAAADADAAARAAAAAADADARAAARAAAAAADAAARAAAAAAARAAARAADAAEPHDFWAHAISILVEAIHLDPQIKPAQWDYTRVSELVKEFA